MMWMILFFLLPLLGVAYCGWHVWTLLPLPRVWRAVVVGVGVASFLLMFLNLSRQIDRWPLWLARLCYDVGCSSIFVMLYLVMLFLVLDLGRLLHLVPRAWLHHNFCTTAVVLVGLFAVFLLANVNYRHKVREELHVATAKPLARPLRLVMVSDLHLGYHNPRCELARWVDLINAEQPDVVLIAGDIIDMSIRPLVEENMAEEFHRLKAPVYACLGNHEYYSGEPLARQFYRDAGIHLLRDSCATLGDLLIVGRDDRTNPRRKALVEILNKQTQAQAPQAPPSAPEGATIVSPQNGKTIEAPSGAVGGGLAFCPFTIVLDHQPYHLEEAEQAGVDFQLSGHTHRGQVWPISWVTDALYECSFGPWQRGNTRYYVSSGIGIWGGKYRIGTQSEYIVMTLSNQ